MAEIYSVKERYGKRASPRPQVTLTLLPGQNFPTEEIVENFSIVIYIDQKLEPLKEVSNSFSSI